MGFAGRFRPWNASLADPPRACLRGQPAPPAKALADLMPPGLSLAPSGDQLLYLGIQVLGREVEVHAVPGAGSGTFWNL